MINIHLLSMLWLCKLTKSLLIGKYTFTEEKVNFGTAGHAPKMTAGTGNMDLIFLDIQWHPELSHGKQHCKAEPLLQ